MSEIKMVELKAKVCVAALCVCESASLHPHSAATTVLQPHTRHHSHSLLHTQPHSHSHSHNPPQPQLAAPQVKMSSGPHASRIVRKYRRSRLKRVKKQEYKKLRDMVPALQEKPRVSKVEVIEEAIKYIDELHTALIERFRTRGLPATLRGESAIRFLGICAGFRGKGTLVFTLAPLSAEEGDTNVLSLKVAN
ncbi:uncharacterized protein LOC122247082 [Penaeus japonicus]|uniref:uncharacterized protein LOC122247082 n=1 Tax=Penaeus japonicus TaxID=27405 RepID=UPI001C7144FA|nr:uncharacterized protein LOC122247082 [Penaeus japonicus]